MWLRFKKSSGSSPGPGRLGQVMMGGMLLFLGGCTVGPNYVRPPAAAPPAYKETPGWKVAQPRDELPRGPWWEIYNDPKLNALEEQVDINNQNIAAAEANFRQAVAMVKVAWAAFFPTVTGGPSWSRFSRSGTIGITNSTLAGASGTGVSPGAITTSSGGTLSDYLLNLSASWELDIWGQVRRSVEASKATAQASAATLEGARLSARATLAQDYFQLRTLDVQKRLLNDTAAAYLKILVFTKNQYAQGVASAGDVAISEATYKATQAQAIAVGVQRAQLEHAIAVLMGKSPSVFAIPEVREPMKAPPVPYGVPSQLLERRPDIAAAERNMCAANAQIGVAIAAYYPTITLSATSGFEASIAPLWLTWPSRFWSLGAAAAETIFKGGALVATTAAARAAYDSTVATYRQTVLAGFQQVEDNLAALGILKNEDKVQNEAVKASKKSLEVSTNQYYQGIISRITLLTVEVVALNNEVTAITIMGSLMSAHVLLIEALGGGWQASELPFVRQRPPEAQPDNQAIAGRAEPERYAGLSRQEGR